MLPTYADGDRLIAVRPAIARRIATGDVVVLRVPAPPNDPPASLGATVVVVKRVGASGGDALPGDATAVAPAGSYFVQGDNGPSYDSRAFGVVPADAVVAKVLGRLG